MSLVSGSCEAEMSLTSDHEEPCHSMFLEYLNIQADSDKRITFFMNTDKGLHVQFFSTHCNTGEMASLGFSPNTAETIRPFYPYAYCLLATASGSQFAASAI
jgi:hypothetical protein